VRSSAIAAGGDVIIENARRSTMEALTDWTLSADRVLVF